jgi:hypothetical protein
MQKREKESYECRMIQKGKRGTRTGHYVIVPYVRIPNVTIPKLVKIPNINRNPAISPPCLVTFPLT